MYLLVSQSCQVTTPLSLCPFNRYPPPTMPVANQAETYLLACTSIVRDLIDALSNPDPKKEINLNALRKQYGKKYKMKGVPRLVDILSAVPEEWRDRLRGALRAKPVRTASGVSRRFLRECRDRC